MAHPLAAHQDISLRLRPDVAAPTHTLEQRKALMANSPAGERRLCFSFPRSSSKPCHAPTHRIRQHCKPCARPCRRARSAPAKLLSAHWMRRNSIPTLMRSCISIPQLTLAQAQAADDAAGQRQGRPLTGMPIAHKDVFVTQGWRTTAAKQNAGQLHQPFRRHGGQPPEAGRRGLDRQTQLRRIRHGLGQRKFGIWPGQKPMGSLGRSGRLVGRLGRRRGGRTGHGRHRHRYRRLGAPARRAMRRQRHQAYLRHRFAFRHGGLSAQAWIRPAPLHAMPKTCSNCSTP